MARTTKRGLDYFQLDTDIFLNRKIKRLIKSFGAKGFMIYSFVIAEVYRDKGCFLVWDEDTAFDVSDVLNLPENLVIEVVNYCGTVGLFNKKLLAGGNVTSKNIQERWLNICKLAKRKDLEIPSEINLLIENSELIAKTPEEKRLIPEEKPKTPEESTQRKEKERKVNKNKGKRKSQAFSPPTFEDFKIYAMNKCIEKNLELDLTKLSLKYDSWKESDWITGKGVPIKNWKSTLLNTLPYLQKEKSSAKKESFRGSSSVMIN